MPRVLRSIRYHIDKFVDDETEQEFLNEWQFIKREWQKFPPRKKIKVGGREMFQWQYQYMLRDQLEELVSWASANDDGEVEEIYDLEPEPLENVVIQAPEPQPAQGNKIEKAITERNAAQISAAQEVARSFAKIG